MRFTYDYPRPCVTTDCLIFRKMESGWGLLLIERGNEPFKGCWALPGGFLEMEGVFLIVITGIVFSIFGAFLAGCIDDQILRICFGAFLCFLGCFQLYNVIKPNKNGLQK